jgi:tetratricopeptide (TPR) repeat protein
VRVEQALRLLPGLDALWPLRSLLLASGQTTEQHQWSGARAYLTVGKYDVQIPALRRALAPALHGITAHLEQLYTAYTDALECMEGNERPRAVQRLVEAGDIERDTGRLVEAGAWYAVALHVAEELQDRRPEVVSLLALARLNKFLGAYEESARQYQRALALARAEFDPPGAIEACVGLGGVQVALGEWLGAQAWYARALRLAESAGSADAIARIHHATGEFLRLRGDYALAEAELRAARTAYETLGNTHELARVLCTVGLLDADMGMPSRAAGEFLEALAWLRTDDRAVGLEVFVRYNFAKLHVDAGRFVEAEDEIRRAEDLAIANSLLGRLAELYDLLGTARGLQRDDTGFVFFEQAIALVGMLPRSQLLEAQIYHDYGVFMTRLDRRDEARAYLTHAHKLFESLGASGMLQSVEAALATVSA